MKLNSKIVISAFIALLFSVPVLADLKTKTSSVSIDYTPSGSISATNVNAAIAELDTEKSAIASPTFTGTVTLPTVTLSGNLTATGRLIAPVGAVAYLNTTGTSVTIASQSDGSTNLVAVAPTTAAVIDSGFDNGGSNNGNLRYTGATTKYANIVVNVSGTPATANDAFILYATKNGTAITGCGALKTFTATESVAFNCLASLATNDVIAVKIGNLTAGRDITIKSLRVQALML